MYIRILIALILGSFLMATNSSAENALSSVQIVEGMTQQRPPNTRRTIGRRYVWNFRGKHYTVLMTIDLEQYNSYAGKERHDIPKLVEEGRTTIGNLTREFQKTFKRYGNWSRQDRVDFVLSFVQSLPYTLDDVTTGYDEFRRYAVETLIEGGGDCEDTTILVAAILRGLGESTALIFTPGHVALGVSGDFIGSSVTHNGIKYYYCETTGTGWTVGVLPASVGKTVEAIVPLTPSKLAPVPRPNKVTTPESIPPKQTPEITEPTPLTPPIKPSLEDPKSEKQGSTDESDTLGAMIAIIFIIVVLGIPLVYIVHRFVFPDTGDDSPDNDTEFDDSFESTDSSTTNPLDW